MINTKVSVRGSVLQNTADLCGIPADFSEICLGKRCSCSLLCRVIFRNYRVVGVSDLGDILSLSGHGAGQPAQALSRGWEAQW